MTAVRRAVLAGSSATAFAATALIASTAQAGGLLLYEFGTAEPGLAAAGYRVQDADLVGVSVMPSIAYRVNDKLSLGAGINGMYGMFDQRVAINNAVPSLGDGRLEIYDDTWGWGGNVGWQDWSEFGEVEIGIDNAQNPVSLTNPLSFDDTWHAAVGAEIWWAHTTSRWPSC